jgi:ubiquinone/menaquinone biosynthesis C-methylase UbiE
VIHSTLLMEFLRPGYLQLDFVMSIENGVVMKHVEIKLLPCTMINKKNPVLRDIDLLTNGLFMEIGWHYYVDLIWIIQNLQNHDIRPGATILDAGAGNGLLQFLLAFYGYNVLSVDFSPRKFNPVVNHLFKIKKISSPVEYDHPYISHVKEVKRTRNSLKKVCGLFKKGRLNPISSFIIELRMMFSKTRPGVINLFQMDMTNLAMIPTTSVDAVVSISAIEHMQQDEISAAIKEFTRVLKNNCLMIITTSASGSSDWYHQPSQGFCFSYATLSRLFDGNAASTGNFEDYDKVMAGFRNCSALQKRLASDYYLSANNGMPGGVWDPRYVPVGIITTKHNENNKDS